MIPRSRIKDSRNLIAIIADEDTTTGFVLAGIGNAQRGKDPNFFVVNSKTTKSKIEEVFKNFTSSEEIGIVLITQDVADIIRHLIEDYEQIVPTVLEIPSKDRPYDSSKDFVMTRIKKILGDG